MPTAATLMLDLPSVRVLDCPHDPQCPSADAPCRDAARTVCHHPEQGWSLLCNGVILFDDDGQLLPDGRALAPLPGPLPSRRTSAPRSAS